MNLMEVAEGTTTYLICEPSRGSYIYYTNFTWHLRFCDPSEIRIDRRFQTLSEARYALTEVPFDGLCEQAYIIKMINNGDQLIIRKVGE